MFFTGSAFLFILNLRCQGSLTDSHILPKLFIGLYRACFLPRSLVVMEPHPSLPNLKLGTILSLNQIIKWRIYSLGRVFAELSDTMLCKKHPSFSIALDV